MTFAFNAQDVTRAFKLFS